MIIEWEYTGIGAYQQKIKELILKNNYNSVDIGGSINSWSYPECKTYIDAISPKYNDITLHQVNLENEDDRNKVLDYVNQNGKFDFSICSHTIEDIFNPIDVIKFLTKISKKGYIAIPSKFNEFKHLYGNAYRGNGHHKQFLDVKDNKIVIYPKFSFIETDNRSDLILNNGKGDELNIMWDENIDFKVFGDGTPFFGDDSLINAFYNELLND
jgi:hypothetical protein